MTLNLKKKTFAAVLGLSFACVALPGLASEIDNDGRGDCPMDRSQMRQGKGMMGQGLGYHRNGEGMRGGDRRQMSRGFGGGRMMDRFSIIDQNDDGKIGDDEAAAQREMVFAAMDADDDQELSIEEFMDVSMGQGESRNAERRKQRQQAKQARFAPMDTDKSGKVSIGEWMIEGQQRFAAADTNNDGIVTPWEFRAKAR